MTYNYKAIFPWLNDRQLEDMSMGVPAEPMNVPLSKLSQEFMDSVLPIDPQTGYPTNPVQKLLDGASPAELDKYASLLQPVDSSKGNRRLSDSDLVSVTPSRYNLTLTDNDALINQLSEIADNASSSVDSTKPAEEASSSHDNISDV